MLVSGSRYVKITSELTTGICGSFPGSVKTVIGAFSLPTGFGSGASGAAAAAVAAAVSVSVSLCSWWFALVAARSCLCSMATTGTDVPSPSLADFWSHVTSGLMVVAGMGSDPTADADTASSAGTTGTTGTAGSRSC